MQPDVAVVIAAKDEQDRIAATVEAAWSLPGIGVVVVVDDGSADATARLAAGAGARVARHARNRGKGAAMETGAEAARLLSSSGDPHLLFLDADLADTAKSAGPLIEPVRTGEADMTIAMFSERVRLGGHGFVTRLSRDGIHRLTGWTATQPLNGQRCLTWAAYEAARPLAPGFGVETALTIDLLREGLRVVEVEVPLAHRATGTDWRSQLHRAKQFRDVARVLAAREPAVQRGVRSLRKRRRA
jgi:glycosyltransferase involved in cell wall biosynthesis